MSVNEELIEVITSSAWMMRALHAVRDTALPHAWVGAGVLRDLVWGQRYGPGFEPDRVRDVDVAFFDPMDLSRARDDRATALLTARLAGVPWEAKNQAAVHTWYPAKFGGGPVAPFTCIREAVESWPETATAVAVRLTGGAAIEVCAPHGLHVTVSFTARPSWQAAPAALHHAVRERAGVVVDVRDVTGGMTPGPAAVLTLTGGSQVFVKAMSQTINPDSHRLYRQEAAILPVLPPPVPAARLHATVETGDWIALIMDAVSGPVAGPPWTTPAVHAAAHACTILAGTAAPQVLPPAIERLPDLDGRAKLAAQPDGLTGWERRHIDRLAAATTGWDWTSGRQLCHRDVRGDNIILDPVGARAVLVDWGCACRAAPWLDRALLAADVMAAGHEAGPQAARELAFGLLADQPIEAARFVIAQTGMWRRNSTLPEHPGMPTHRQWQRDRAVALQPLLEDLLPPIDRRTASRSR